MTYLLLPLAIIILLIGQYLLSYYLMNRYSASSGKVLFLLLLSSTTLLLTETQLLSQAWAEVISPWGSWLVYLFIFLLSVRAFRKIKQTKPEVVTWNKATKSSE